MKNTKTKTIYFDLDGTVYPLYSQERWLERITLDLDPTAYSAEVTIPDPAALLDVLLSLVAEGWTIGVISWLANGIPAESPIVPANAEYKKAARRAKREWIRKFLPMATEIHIVQYGTPKHRIVSDPYAILVDDSAKVRAAWRGQTIDATGDIIAALKRIQ